MNIIRYIVLIFSFLLLPDLHANEEVSNPGYCSFFPGELSPSTIDEVFSPKNVLFSSTSEAENIIKRILSISGLISRNIVIRPSSKISNAMATIRERGTKRYIVYNPLFVSKINTFTNNKWAAVTLLAHELGHHLNGHTLDRIGSTPTVELEADKFSGFALQKMGASLNDALALYNMLPNPHGSLTHPPQKLRLKAARRGWNEACNSDTQCISIGQQSLPLPSPPLARTQNKKAIVKVKEDAGLIDIRDINELKRILTNY